MVIVTEVERVKTRKKIPEGITGGLNAGTLSRMGGTSTCRQLSPHAEPVPGWSTRPGAVYLTFTKSYEQFVFSASKKHKGFVKSQEALQNGKIVWYLF